MGKPRKNNLQLPPHDAFNDEGILVVTKVTSAPSCAGWLLVGLRLPGTSQVSGCFFRCVPTLGPWDRGEVLSVLPTSPLGCAWASLRCSGTFPCLSRATPLLLPVSRSWPDVPSIFIQMPVYSYHFSFLRIIVNDENGLSLFYHPARCFDWAGGVLKSWGKPSKWPLSHPESMAVLCEVPIVPEFIVFEFGNKFKCNALCIGC